MIFCDDTHLSRSAGEPPDRQRSMPPRHRFLEPIHNVKERGEPLSPQGEPCENLVFISGVWWSQPGSNRRPQACKASALPTELWPRRPTQKSGKGQAKIQWWAEKELNLRPHAYQA